MIDKMRALFSRKNYESKRDGRVDTMRIEGGNDRYNNMADVRRWNSIYEGNPPWLSDKVFTRKTATSIVSEIATMATIEFESEIVCKEKGDEKASYLNSQYQHLIDRTRVIIEYMLVQGGIVLKAFPSGSRVGVEMKLAGSFIPLKFNDFGELIDVVFIDEVVDDKETYTRHERHVLEDGIYTVTNTAYLGKNIKVGNNSNIIPLEVVKEWAELEYKHVTHDATYPTYSYLRAPFGNSDSMSSPLGSSLFSRIEGLLEDYDRLNSATSWEFESAERLVFAANELFKRLNDRDVSKRLYRKFEMDTVGQTGALGLDSLIDVFNPDIRVEAFTQGKEEILRAIEFNSGLGRGELSRVDQVDKTAEEIKSSKQSSSRTIVDIQKVIEKSYKEVAKAIELIATEFIDDMPESDEEYIPTFHFDDSIVVDSKSEIEIMMDEFEKGLISPEEYLSRRYGWTTEQAREQLRLNKEYRDGGPNKVSNEESDEE